MFKNLKFIKILNIVLLRTGIVKACKKIVRELPLSSECFAWKLYF